jgi:two-component system, NtrC family, response regulator AtoC
MNRALERYGEIFGNSERMRELGGTVVELATMTSSVLIRGEAGVGKAAMAQALHCLSNRSSSPFVTIACAAAPTDVLETEMFGPRGKVRAAGPGTLFVKDFDRLPEPLQAGLAVALSQRRPACRLIASSSADLHALLAVGALRRDLHDVLADNVINVPPLRDRREEIPELIRHFVAKFSRAFQRPAPPISPALEALLVAYDWPGNIVELEGMIKRWVVLGDENLLRAELATRARVAHRTRPGREDRPPGLRDIGRQAAREAERAALQAALARTGGNRAAAARELRVSYKTLLQKLAEAGITDATRGKRKR